MTRCWLAGTIRMQYTECLLGLARVGAASGARVSAVGMAMPGSYLPERIRRIVAGAQVQRISRGRMISVAVVCAVVSTVFTCWCDWLCAGRGVDQFGCAGGGGCASRRGARDCGSSRRRAMRKKQAVVGHGAEYCHGSCQPRRRANVVGCSRWTRRARWCRMRRLRW